MKICHIITRMIVGGAQENTLFSAQGAYEAGHETVLLTGPSPGPEGELLRENGAVPGFQIVECPWLCRELSPRMDWKAYRFLKRFFKENHFDVVHTHSSKAGILGRLAARAAGVPLVLHTIHGLAFHRYEKAWKNRIYILLERYAARHCDKIYAVAQAMIEQSLDAGIGTRSMYQVVYSGMNLTPFLNSVPDADLRRSLGIPADAKVIGTVARLFPLKGYETLFRIAPALFAKERNLHFLFVGNGSMREELEEEARRNGFLEHISFAGLVPPSEVYRYIALMDVLVHFSLREGLPRAAVQGLASGKPVLAYALDGTPEVVIDGKTGRLLQPGDDLGAETALSALLADSESCRKMGENGRALVRTLFDWHRMSDILLEDYERELKKKRSS